MSHYYDISQNPKPRCRLCELSGDGKPGQCLSGNHCFWAFSDEECYYHPDDPPRPDLDNKIRNSLMSESDAFIRTGGVDLQPRPIEFRAPTERKISYICWRELIECGDALREMGFLVPDIAVCGTYDAYFIGLPVGWSIKWLETNVAHAKILDETGSIRVEMKDTRYHSSPMSVCFCSYAIINSVPSSELKSQYYEAKAKWLETVAADVENREVCGCKKGTHPLCDGCGDCDDCGFEKYNPECLDYIDSRFFENQ